MEWAERGQPRARTARQSSRRSSATTSSRPSATGPSWGRSTSRASIAARAAAKLGSAGRRAFARGDTPAACNLLRRATALLPTDAPTRVELIGELADALMEEGQFDEARLVIADGTAVADRLGDERLLARMRIGASRIDVILSELASSQDAIAEARAAIDVLAAAGDEGASPAPGAT